MHYYYYFKTENIYLKLLQLIKIYFCKNNYTGIGVFTLNLCQRVIFSRCCLSGCLCVTAAVTCMSSASTGPWLQTLQAPRITANPALSGPFTEMLLSEPSAPLNQTCVIYRLARLA